ncbi:MAG: OsmC family protein [Methanomassiliicoccales archaeon]|jgi:uncharacterized OsmC-like protein|nr:OsmC family protein [Methanomassiliicoccales archaeon]MDD1755581.1 OsmC family protein [Methanomassiliicoccales archaeon]
MEEGEFKVRIEPIEGYEYRVSFSKESIPDLVMDEPSPLGRGEHPNAGLLLAAAVGNCLCASLTYCLSRARAEVKGVSAEVYTTLDRNERGRLRVKSIRVQLHPEMDDPKKLERCREIFEDFCIVTQSVREGVPVQVEVETPAGAPGNR